MLRVPLRDHHSSGSLPNCLSSLPEQFRARSGTGTTPLARPGVGRAGGSRAGPRTFISPPYTRRTTAPARSAIQQDQQTAVGQHNRSPSQKADVRSREGPFVSDTTDLMGVTADKSVDSAAPAEGAATGTTARRRRSGTGLEGMVLAELQQVASGLGIRGTARMRKSQLIEVIKEAQAGGGSAAPKASSKAAEAPAEAESKPKRRATSKARTGDEPAAAAAEKDTAQQQIDIPGRSRPATTSPRASVVAAVRPRRRAAPTPRPRRRPRSRPRRSPRPSRRPRSGASPRATPGPRPPPTRPRAVAETVATAVSGVSAASAVSASATVAARATTRASRAAAGSARSARARAVAARGRASRTATTVRRTTSTTRRAAAVAVAAATATAVAVAGATTSPAMCRWPTTTS